MGVAEGEDAEEQSLFKRITENPTSGIPLRTHERAKRLNMKSALTHHN